MFKFGKKAQQLNLGALWGILVLGAVVVVSGIFLAYGADIVSDVQTDFTANSAAYNVTQDSLTAIGNVAEKQDTVTNIGIAAIVLGLLLSVAAGVMVFKNYM